MKAFLPIYYWFMIWGLQAQLNSRFPTYLMSSGIQLTIHLSASQNVVGQMGVNIKAWWNN
ncbi:MAG: hypothetical protein AAFU03_07735 [Bacteroidota bacterium]